MKLASERSAGASIVTEAAGEPVSAVNAVSAATANMMRAVSDADDGRHPASPGLFDDVSRWLPAVSGQSRLKLSAARAPQGRALRLDYTFDRSGGFVAIGCTLLRPMPQDYVIRFRLRGGSGAEQLELKLLDSGGQNVWRYTLNPLRPSARWRALEIESSAIEFAWGPASDSVITQLGRIEFAILANGGGSGGLWLSDLEIVDRVNTVSPRLRASSERDDHGAANAVLPGGWAPRADDVAPWIEIDLMQQRHLGGLVIDWLDTAPASGFVVQAAHRGTRWTTIYRAECGGGARSYVALPDTHAHRLRLQMSEACAGARLALQGYEFSRSMAAFWHTIAATEARRAHPRWLHREQTRWTPIGSPDHADSALISEDGAIEPYPGAFSIEPMLWSDGQLVGWSDVSSDQQLQEGWIPAPSVVWRDARWRLTITGESMSSGALRLRYQVENLGDAELSLRLFLLVRPFQVTPPWQQFKQWGGISRIHDLFCTDGALRVNQHRRLIPDTQTDATAAETGSLIALGFGARSFDEGSVVADLEHGQLPPRAEAHDRHGLATGVFGFELRLGAAQSRTLELNCLGDDGAPAVADRAFDWNSLLRPTQWHGNDWAADAILPAATAAAHILLLRDGAALRSGPRRYARSWIRDGAVMSAALLRMGSLAPVRAYILWYLRFQRADGFVPSCVDAQGADTRVEHDSHGELIVLIADHHRFSGDIDFLKLVWPHVERSAGFIERVIEHDGLLPISVSHEGYLSQPVHSYWDDAWALRGLRDAAELALLLQHEALAQHYRTLAANLSRALAASIAATRARHTLDFVPASLEWADFDPTATANAITLLDLLPEFDRASVEQTFERYYREWRRRQSGAQTWTNYSPYEIRIIGVFVRLGRREVALELLRYFLDARQPKAWNQWSEIVWRDAQTPGNLGDLPHGWVAAEYVLALRSLFAYECEAQQGLILAAGIASEWLDGGGVIVDRMPTAFGPLSYRLKRVDACMLEGRIESGIAGRVRLSPPVGSAIVRVEVNGIAHTAFDAASVSLDQFPARFLIHCAAA